MSAVNTCFLILLKGEGVVRVEELLVIGIRGVSAGSNLSEDVVGLFHEVLVDDIVVRGVEVDIYGAT